MKKNPKWPWLAIAWIKLFQHFFLVTHLFQWNSLSYVQSTTVTNISQHFRNVRIVDGNTYVTKESIESSLQTIHDISTENLGTLCLSQLFRPLKVPLNVERYDGARQKADLAAIVLQEVGVSRHGGLLDALAKGLLSDPHVTSSRILGTNITSGIIINSVWWSKQAGGLSESTRIEEDGVAVGVKPDSSYPWFEDEDSTPDLRSPKFVPSPLNASFRGWWTYPYYSCSLRRWILSYSVAIPPVGRHGMRGFLSIDIDVTELQVDQCELPNYPPLFEMDQFDFVTPPTPSPLPIQLSTTLITTTTGKSLSSFHNNKYQPVKSIEHFFQIQVFHGSHKCHLDSMQCEYRAPQNYNINKNTLNTPNGWSRGSYQCLCRAGFYSARHPTGFNGTIMEVAYEEFRENISTYYVEAFKCSPCAPGCTHCSSPAPCLATYNWPFRVTLLTFSVLCAIFTVLLALYLFQHRKVKVFKVASPIFLTITLFGCATMYLEMAAIFPILDTYSCIATKWTRHFGFCITYTALLMKTWRVSLTYRVKSAHKVKLTDKQLLQWMVPILLVMLIYLGTWTLSAPPNAEKITDQYGLIFKQCSYNWWDHSLAIGEVIFLAWGIRVCYNVRNAESLYNEAKLISYAIYNIALVNTTMVAFHLLIFPQAGPDIKYLLGFIRTQLSTSVTMALVFGPKMFRVLRGQGDQWDNRARVRGITASFSLNGVGLVAEETADLYQENEELKEEIQKLASQIEFMKIVHMEINNRHLKPKPGGYFTLQSPMGKNFSTRAQKSRKSKPLQPQQLTQLITNKDYEAKIETKKSAISEDGHSGSNSISGGGVSEKAENLSDTATSTVISNPSNVLQQHQPPAPEPNGGQQQLQPLQQINDTEKV